MLWPGSRMYREGVTLIAIKGTYLGGKVLFCFLQLPDRTNKECQKLLVCQMQLSKSRCSMMLQELWSFLASINILNVTLMTRSCWKLLSLVCHWPGSLAAWESGFLSHVSQSPGMPSGCRLAPKPAKAGTVASNAQQSRHCSAANPEIKMILTDAS